MTLMTTFWEEGRKGKGETQNHRRFLPSAYGPHGTCDGIAGNGGPAGEERKN